jgi:hypothetical protein
MKVGKNKCVIVDMGFGQSKEKQTPFYVLDFENEEGETIQYVAYLTDATKERQLGVLADLGYQGKSLADMASDKKVSDLFPELEEPIFVVVEEEEYQNDKGELKKRSVAKWVNVGNKGGVNKLDHKQAVVICKSLSFDGDLAQLRSKRPAPKLKTDEIPF